MNKASIRDALYPTEISSKKIPVRLDVWNLIPGEGNAGLVKSMVKSKIQAEALRTYIFTYSPHYESLSLLTLCEMFDMEKPKAHSLISKMMLNQVGWVVCLDLCVVLCPTISSKCVVEEGDGQQDVAQHYVMMSKAQ